jgi:hypothetical protein
MPRGLTAPESPTLPNWLADETARKPRAER